MTICVDACVAGGGLAGVAAAVSLARGGFKVLLAESRGCLGWEVTRAGRMYAQLREGDCAAALADLLSDRSGYQDGVLNPAITEMALDRLAVAAGVRLLFHARPHQLLHSHQRVTGVAFATRSGVLPVTAPLVLDCTHTGRLLRETRAAWEPAPDLGTTCSILLARTSLTEPLTVATGLPPEVRSLQLQPLAGGRCLLEIHLTPGSMVDRHASATAGEVALGRVFLPVWDLLRRQVSGLAEAIVLLVAAEAWRLPTLVLEAQNPQTAAGMEGVHAAGAYVGKVRALLAATNQPADVLLAVGEQAGKAAGQLLRGGESCSVVS